MDDLEYVVNNSTYVSLNLDNLDKFINSLGDIKYSYWLNDLNLNLNEKEIILLVFIIESMNFCFWEKPKWVIEYDGERISGSNALFYSIIKEVKNNKDFLNIYYLNSLNFDNFKKIFTGIENECPHLDKRYNNFRATISYIVSHDFYNELFNIKNNNELLNYIVSNFKHFDDKSIYKDRVIYFYKRANLLANDLYQVSDTIRKNIHDVNNLRGCADYGIPRTFRDYGIMIYNEELSKMVDNEIEIPHDSEMEIEIRANMLYVIEIIKNKLLDKGIMINSVELDNIVWNMGKRNESRSNSHHTITIYY